MQDNGSHKSDRASELKEISRTPDFSSLTSDCIELYYDYAVSRRSRMSSSASAVPAIETVGAESLEISDRDATENGRDPSFDPTHAPIDVHGEISKLAYSLWCQRGCPDGTPEVDWFMAEQKYREG